MPKRNLCYLTGKTWAMNKLLKEGPQALEPIRKVAQDRVDNGDFENKHFGRGALSACDDFEREMGDDGDDK